MRRVVFLLTLRICVGTSWRLQRHITKIFRFRTSSSNMTRKATLVHQCLQQGLAEE